jgi:hypothetical protein
VGRALTALRTGARWGGPIAGTVANSHRAANRTDDLVVAPSGDRDANVALATVFGARVGMPYRDDLLVGVALPGQDIEELAGIVGNHRRAGGDALVLLVGDAPARRALERGLRSDPDVGIAVMMFVEALTGPDLDRIRHRVASLVVSHADGRRRIRHTLQSDVAREMEHRQAFRLALRAMAVADPEKTAASMKAVHTKLASDSAATPGSAIDPKNVGFVVALALLAPIWRRGAGRLTPLVPFTRVVIRGAAAYGVTRLVGMGARRLSTQDRNVHREER